MVPDNAGLLAARWELSSQNKTTKGEVASPEESRKFDKAANSKTRRGRGPKTVIKNASFMSDSHAERSHVQTAG